MCSESLADLENVLLDNRKMIQNLLGGLFSCMPLQLPESSGRVYETIQES
jgi:hypothetical protein